MTVITTSVALATVLLGLAAFAGGSETLELPDSASVPLRVALLAFLVAGVLALATNTPWLYPRTDETKLAAAIEDSTDDTVIEATQAVAYNRLEIFVGAARVNQWKAITLLGAMIAEVVAVAAIAYTVWIVV